jgi:hypothetical protein
MFLIIQFILLGLFICSLVLLVVSKRSNRRKYFVALAAFLLVLFILSIAQDVIDSMPNSDEGNECFDSSECLGYCTFDGFPGVNDSEKVMGRCSRNRLSSGCHNVIINGSTGGICVD